MTVDPSTLSPAELAHRLDNLAGNLDQLHRPSAYFDAALIREAARRIAPATAALGDVAVEAAARAALCPCLCHSIGAGLGYSHRVVDLDGVPVAPCCATPGRKFTAIERRAALMAAADRAFG